MSDQDKIRQVLEMRQCNIKKLLKNLKKNQQIVANKKKGEEVKAKARMDIQAIERELVFREVLNDIKRVHYYRALTDIFEPPQPIRAGLNSIRRAKSS